METSYHHIIAAFIDKYRLSRGQVIAEIERTFSSMLSRWHRKNVVVVFSEGQLLAVAYHDDAAGIIQTPIDLAAMRGWNTIKKILDKNLSMAACFDEVSKYKHRENSVIWGEVISQNETSMGVELEMEFGVTLYARCPLKYLGKHERNQLCVGDRRAFHLRRVESVLLGDTPRTQITVDRISKSLVEQLLKEQLGPASSKMTIRCQKRFVGQKSFIESSAYIPKKAILSTSKELGEHIQVRIIAQKKNI